jgi:hypothetical protein
MEAAAMKRCLALALLAAAGWCVGMGRGQAPGRLGPGEEGAVLKQPWDTAGSSSSSTPRPASAPLQGLWRETNPQAPGGTAAFLRELESAPPDPNQDIAVTRDHGPWMISIQAYIGPNAPQSARRMVDELRSKYKLPAYVFNHSNEERRKEHERLLAQIEKQRQLLEQTRKELGNQAYQINPIPIKRPMRIQDNCAVLVGGYKDEVTARRALDQIRKLDANLLDRALLDTKYFGEDDPKTKKIERGRHEYVNPFLRAFAAPNPAVKLERRQGFDDQDVAVLRRLNDGQPYNLMACKKRYTLAIKQFAMPGGVQTDSAKPAGVLDSFKTGKSHADLAADNAHEFAKMLRHMKLDAYVLHTRFASIITVGGYDSLEDPALRSMQNIVANQLRPKLDARIELFPQPLPMEVPH